MKIICATLALAAVMLPVTASATPAEESIAVTISDLELTSERGQRILALRIKRAARTICETQVLESLPNNMRRERACIRDAQAITEAVKGSKLSAQYIDR